MCSLPRRFRAERDGCCIIKREIDAFCLNDLGADAGREELSGDACCRPLCSCPLAYLDNTCSLSFTLSTFATFPVPFRHHVT